MKQKNKVIIDYKKFKHTSPKVLFILQEVIKFPSDDLRTLSKEDFSGLVKNIARCSAGIYNNFPEYEEIEKMEDALLRQYAAKVAVICLKKVSDNSASLLEQIGLIKPVLIVACNTFDSLIKLLGLATKDNLYEPVLDARRKAWLIPLQYPVATNRFPTAINGKEMYDNLKSQIWNKIDY
jgi:hypothetical protein